MRCLRAIALLVSLTVATGVPVLSGSSGSASSSAPGQPFPRVDQAGVLDHGLRVGGVVSKTNPLGGNYASAFDGVKAYFDMVNASKDKGIYGRKLRLTSQRDDQVAMNRQEVQALLSEDDVFAALPIAVLLFTGADLLGQSGARPSVGTSTPSGAPSRPRARRTCSARRARTCASRVRASLCRGSPGR